LNIIGLDPGVTGAIARLYEPVGGGLVAQVWDTPTGKDGKRTIFLPAEMRALLADAVGDKVTTVFIESVHSMPKQGVSSSFGFGVGYGMWIGLVAGLGLPYELVTPQRWQSVMMAGLPKEPDKKKRKDASRARAQQLFPSLVSQLNRVKDDGRAEALLIASYGRRLLGGGV